MVRPILIDVNPVELKYYPFMISLDKCNGSCNILSSKIYVSIETKNINVKAFIMITKKNEVKTMAKYISCDCKCKFQWNNKTCQYEYKYDRTLKKIIVGIIAHVFVRIASIQNLLLILK